MTIIIYLFVILFHFVHIQSKWIWICGMRHVCANTPWTPWSLHGVHCTGLSQQSYYRASMLPDGRTMIRMFFEFVGDQALRTGGRLLQGRGIQQVRHIKSVIARDSRFFFINNSAMQVPKYTTVVCILDACWRSSYFWINPVWSGIISRAEHKIQYIERQGTWKKEAWWKVAQWLGWLILDRLNLLNRRTSGMLLS